MDNRIILAIVGILAFVCALVLGDKVATADYRTIAMYALALFSIVYLLRLYRYSTILIILVALSGTSMQLPIGRVSSTHLALGLFCLTAGYELLRRSPDHKTIRAWKGGMAFYICAILIIGCLYLYQITEPVNPNEFSIKQTLKALIETLGPFLVMLFWCIKSDAYVFRMGPMRPMLIVLSVLLGFHIGFRCYLISIGAVDFGEDSMGMDETAASYRLPGGISVSQYILRIIGPLAVIIGAFVALSPQSKGHKSKHSLFAWCFAWLAGLLPFWFRWTRGMAWTLVVYGMIGALLSSGRAAMLTAVLGVFIALAYYRHFVAIMATGAFVVLTIAMLNIFASVIEEKLPSSVTRSLSLVIFSDGAGAGAKSVKSSTNWRYELAELAFDEWTSDTDILIRGRGVYSFTYLDANAMALEGGYVGRMESSLKTGNAHVQWLVLALKFGLFAIMLWYILHAYLCIRGVGIMRKFGYHSVSPLFAACVCLLCISFFLSLISTGGMNFVTILGMLVGTRHMMGSDTSGVEKPGRPEEDHVLQG